MASVSSVDQTNGNVTLAWSSVEGGTYKVEASSDLSVGWTTLTSTQAAASNAVSTTYLESAAALAHTERYYRCTRLTLASYDNGTVTSTPEGISTVSPATGVRNTTVTLSITLNSAYNPAPPPSTNPPTSVTLTRTGFTTITATSFSRNSTTGVVTAIFSLSTATAGAYTVNALFGPNTWSLTNGFNVTATAQPQTAPKVLTIPKVLTTVKRTLK